MDANQKKEVDKLLKKMNKEHETNIMMLGDTPPIDISTVIQTEIHELNEAFGVGGVPRGSIIEIYGPEAAGKTTVALHIIAQVQKRGGLAAFVDVEHALNVSLAVLIGVNPDDLVFYQPDSGEEAMQVSRELLESGLFDVIVVDSVAALVPEAMLKKDIGDSASRAQVANLMSESLRVISPVAKKSRTAMIFINQIREKPGVMFGSPEYTPGGRALRFYASLRIEARKGEVIKEGGIQVGHKLKIHILKNKFAPPFKRAEIPLHYYKGIDTTTGVIETAVGWGVIDQGNGGMYYYKTEKWDKKWQGKAVMIAEVSTNHELFNDVRDMVNEVIREAKADGSYVEPQTSEVGTSEEEPQ